MKKRSIYIFLFLISLNGVAQTFNKKQQHQLDSLNTIINTSTSPDTSLADAYVSLSEILYVTNIDTIEPLCESAKAIIDEGLSKSPSKLIEGKLLKALGSSLNNIGYSYTVHGDIPEALKYYRKGLKIREEIKDKKGIANSLNNIGIIYKRMGDLPEALKYYHKSLKIKKEIDDKSGVGTSLNNIGGIYDSMGDAPEALKYYHKSLKVREEIDDKKGIANSLSNIGAAYNDQGNIPKALKYHEEALKIRMGTGDKNGVGISLYNIGSIYTKKQEYDKALGYYYQSLEIQEAADDKRHLSSSLSNVGRIMFKKGNLQEAQSYGERSLKLAQEVGYPENISSSSNLLSQIYEEQNKDALALKMYKLYSTMNDSMSNESNQKSIVQQQAKYVYEKQKAIDDAAHDKQLALDQEEKEKQQIITVAIGSGLALTIVFLLFIFNRLQVAKTQKATIENQNKELSSKNDMITDSINYAKKIQKAILPDQGPFKKVFQDIFIFYKPKDIVSGDFYWGYKTEKEILFTVADCTGHGVPGAFMSLIGSNILDKIVGELNIIRPDQILEQLSKELYKRLRSEGESNIKDGMDLVMCSINLETKKLQFSGAYNPMYIVRNQELIQFKTDRYQLGNPDHLANKNFTLQTFDLQKDDIIYLFSDGFPDQKGGEKGKKYFYPPFRDFLTKNSELSLAKQHDLLEKELINWKGDKEQLDDILIMGIKI